jgi:hypothetical protein
MAWNIHFLVEPPYLSFQEAEEPVLVAHRVLLRLVLAVFVNFLFVAQVRHDFVHFSELVAPLVFNFSRCIIVDYRTEISVHKSEAAGHFEPQARRVLIHIVY